MGTTVNRAVIGGAEDRSLWVFSPHFHVVGFGYFRNEALRKKLDALPEFSGQRWIFNQIHADEEMRSVRHTLAYILTHTGIGTFDYDRDIYEIVDDLTIPVESGSGNVRKTKTMLRSLLRGRRIATGIFCRPMMSLPTVFMKVLRMTIIQLYRSSGPRSAELRESLEGCEHAAN